MYIYNTTKYYNMELIKLTPQVFEAFGKKQLLYAVPSSKLFNGMIPTQSDRTEKLFIQQCMKIMKGNKHEVNQIQFNQLLSVVLSTGLDNTTMLIMNIFDTLFTDLADNTQQKLNSKTFTIDDFLNEYQMLYDNSRTLSSCLESLDYHIVTDKGVRDKYSYVILIKNYLLYRNVINRKYDYNDKKVYFYEMITDILKQKMDMKHVLSIFKIYQFYTKLYYVAKNDRDKYFNKDLESKFSLKDNAMAQHFISNILQHVDDTIKKVLKVTEVSSANMLIGQVRDYINMGCNISDKAEFMFLYRKHLTERLLNGHTNPDIETEFINSLNYKDDPELYAKMRYQIHDIKGSKQHNQYFRNIDVGIESEKHKGIDVKKLERDKFNFTIMKSYAWDIESTEQFNVPPELSPYFSIFTVYYGKRFPDRTTSYLYDNSTAIIKMQLGGKTYSIVLTLSQLCVLMSINNAGKISALDLNKQLGIPLKKLGSILNSLLRPMKLITREEGPATDPLLKFSINTSCSFPDEKVNLVSLMRQKPKSETDSNITPQPVVESEVSDTVLKAEIIGTVIKSACTVEQLIAQLSERLKVQVSKSQVDKIVDSYLKSGKLLLQNNTYVYKFEDIKMD